MEDTDITRADMVIITDMAKDRAHMVMKTMETKIKMTLLAVITKKMAKIMMDIAMETVGTVRRGIWIWSRKPWLWPWKRWIRTRKPWIWLWKRRIQTRK